MIALNYLLLFLWFPLSVGIFDGMNDFVIGTMTKQHIVMLLYPLYATAIGFLTGKNIKSKLFIFVFSCMFLHSLINNFSGDTFVKLLAFWGTAQWADYIARKLTFPEVIIVLAKSAAFFLFLSIVYAMIFHDLSFEYLQDRLVMSSFYGQKNTYGRFLQIAILFFFTAFVVFRKGAWLLLVGVAASLLVYSESRTSLFTAILCILVFFAGSKGLVKPLTVFGILIMLLIAVAVGVGVGYIYAYKLGSVHDGIKFLSYEIDLTGRMTVWEAITTSLTMERKWLFGYGYGNYFGKENALRSLSDIGLGEFIPNDPHNGYLDVVVNFGLVGLAVYLFLIFSCFKKFNKSSYEKIQKGFAVSVLFGYVLANTMESYAIKSTNIYNFLFFLLFFERWNFDKLVGKYVKNSLEVGASVWERRQ